MNKSVCIIASVLTASWLGLGMASLKAGPMEKTVAASQERMDKEWRDKGIDSWFARYQAYAAKLLNDSAVTNTYRDKTGNCRLAWFDRLLRNQRTAALEAERFSRELHQSALRETGAFEELTRQGFEKTDIPVKNPIGQNTHDLGLDLFTNSLALMRQAREKAFAPIENRDRFFSSLVAQALSSNFSGHAFADDREGRMVCDILEKVDRKALADGAMEAARLADQWREGGLNKWLDALSSQSTTVTVAGVEGTLAAVWKTSEGLIVVGGVESNVYHLDNNFDITAVLDLGGNDRYEEGTVGEARPVLVLLDRRGDDVYSGLRTGIQGGAVGGISVLLDGAGNDRYAAVDLTQGSCLAGVGLLADLSGDDSYFGDKRGQGSAVGGLGLLWDGGGSDTYHAAAWAQGFGGPLGFGLLEDLAGNDSYYAGGKYPGGYDDSPGYAGWSQGVGAGPRGSANGGVGVLLDGGGDDSYEYDYFSHGGGYWFAVGIARDFGGNDSRLGSTRTCWDGTPRKEKPFVRWGPAYGCHFALGFLFDDAGNDLYTGTTAGNSFGWDIALGALFDAEGNDRYVGGNGGFASQTSFSILADGAGDDQYEPRQAGMASPVSEYHVAVSNCSNFALTYDMGGNDKWACGLSNGQQRVQGWAGGILIDK